MKDNKEGENKVSRKREQVNSNKKSIRLKKPDFKVAEFLKLNKKQIGYLLGFFIVLILIICFYNYDKLGLVLNKNIKDDDVIKVDLISSNNKLYEYKDEVLVVNSEGLTSYNKYGKKTWELELKGAVDDYINTNDKYLQIINHDKSLVHIYKNKYETARIKLDGEILSGNINKNGYSVIEYRTTGSKTILAVYDSKGELEYNVKLNNSIIGEYLLSQDNKYLAYIDANIKGISVSTSVVLVSLKTGEVKTVHSSESSLVYDINFENNSLVYKLEEEIIYHNLKNDKKLISKIENESIVNIDVYGKKYAYSTFENGKYFLTVKNIGGKETKKIEISDTPKYFVYENNIFVCYQKSIVVYNNLKMMLKKYDSSMIITEPTVFNNGRSVAFLVSNKLIMFSI